MMKMFSRSTWVVWAAVLLTGCDEKGTVTIESPITEADAIEERAIASELELANAKVRLLENELRTIDLQMGMTSAALLHGKTSDAVTAISNLATISKHLEVPERSRSIVLSMISMGEVHERGARDALAEAEATADFDPKRLDMMRSQMAMIEKDWPAVVRLKSKLNE